jgi:hypothetical protein
MWCNAGEQKAQLGVLMQNRQLHEEELANSVAGKLGYVASTHILRLYWPGLLAQQ